jgi:Ribosomal L38e protein family
MRPKSIDKALVKRIPMPKSIQSKEEFQNLLESATEVRVVKRGDGAKIKLRTKAALYTFKTTSEEADGLVKGTKVPVAEF